MILSLISATGGGDGHVRLGALYFVVSWVISFVTVVFRYVNVIRNHST